MEPSCRTCRHVEPLISDEDEPFTVCRRYPPVLIVMDDEMHTVWPCVTEDDYCGEYAPPTPE